MKGDEDFLKERQLEIENERKRLNEQFIMLKNSITQTENESGRMDIEKTKIDHPLGKILFGFANGKPGPPSAFRHLVLHIEKKWIGDGVFKKQSFHNRLAMKHRA